MRYTPIAFVLIYLAFTLFLTVFGPIQYHEFAVFSVVGYIFAISLAMFFGFHLAVKSRLVLPTERQVSFELFPKRLFFGSLAAAFAGFIVTLGYFLSDTSINLELTSIGEAYSEAYRGYEKNTGNYSISFILYSLLAPWVFITTVWGLRYFRHLNGVIRLMVLLVVFGTPLIFTLSSGTQKNIGDVVVLLIALAAVRAAARGRVVTPRAVATISVVAILGITIFASILGQRYAAIGIGAENINAREISLLSYNTDHIIFTIAGPDTGFALSAFVMYLTNGFNGLSYALQTDFTWSYFLGNSYPLSVIGQRFLGLPFMYERTYPFIAAFQSGWGENRWYTAFAWFASDFTFVGTIPLFGFFGYVYGRAWSEIVHFENPLATLVFCLMTLGVFYLPANNQLMGTPGGLLTLAITFTLYLGMRRRFNRRLVPYPQAMPAAAGPDQPIRAPGGPVAWGANLTASNPPRP